MAAAHSGNLAWHENKDIEIIGGRIWAKECMKAARQSASGGGQYDGK